MKPQLYTRGRGYPAKKIQEYNLSNPTGIVEIKRNGRWYSLPLTAEIVEFDPVTLTLTTILPFRV